MPELFADEIHGVQVQCSNCGALIELANTGLDVFESSDSVLCLECLVNASVRGGSDSDHLAVPGRERAALIDDVVATFSDHLRRVLALSIKPDLSWDTQFRFEQWNDPADALASAHAPGIWYGLRPRKDLPLS